MTQGLEELTQQEKLSKSRAIRGKAVLHIVSNF